MPVKNISYLVPTHILLQIHLVEECYTEKHCCIIPGLIKNYSFDINSNLQT